MNIIELAKEAGVWDEIGYPKCIERFAALVRAEALEEAAKVCEEVANRYKTGADLEHKHLQVGFLSAERCAYDIRAKDAK